MKSFGLDIRDKVLLFDFDGTIVETECMAQQVIEDYFKEKKYAYSVPSELIIGRTWQAAVESIARDAERMGVSIDPPEELLGGFKKRYHEQLHTGVKLIPGFLECIPFFKAQARFMGIVTGSDHQEVETVLKLHHLETCFDQIWAYGDYSQSKPHPAPYLEALKVLQVGVQDVIVFEDSVAGMESASQAGLAFVQVSHEAHAKKVDPRAIKVISNWKAFLE